MKKILFVSNYRPGAGGISVQVDLLKKHLNEDGYQADVFSTKGSVLRRLGMARKLRKVVDDYDIVHIHCCSHWGFFPAVLGIEVAKRKGKRIVLTYHGGGADVFFAKHRRFVKHYLLQTETNIVMSGFLGKVFDDYGIQSIIIPNIVDFRDGVYCKREVLHPNFICVRSHKPEYNIPCILKAFQIIQGQIGEASLVLLGDGPLHEDLVKLSMEMGLKNVTFTGQVPNDDIYEYLRKSDILLSSPIVDNMPVSILEAMNAGLLVMSSNVGGIPYMVEDGITGLLFESDNHQELAERIMWALQNQNEAIGITNNAKSFVVDYTWKNIKYKYKEVYEV